MLKQGGIILAALLFIGTACSSTMEQVNEGAKETGRTGGKVMNVPTSFSEGAAEEIAGEPESNPYNR